MVETGDVPLKAKYVFIQNTSASRDVERICQEKSEETQPPEALLLSGRSLSNSLLAVSLGFLERGQLLKCPGMPLIGAAFDPEWGFARVEINFNRRGSAEFCLPHGDFDSFTDGDTCGYRLCPVDNHEIPDLIEQLVRIRVELARPRRRPTRKQGIRVEVRSV